ncbi:phosphoribosylamine-glycine ligase [Lacticaseibacillus pantheris DSM 15945 = JCM 12539 = NBRC 106106]|uniref:Phosphoribosylamine--glycine ligase n=1 Tax=Lacticaseibacillus pantheris DSM 15945 = JCM 12539 = NBRC 106106 TaxID=1423783 RepID=A0A0R1TYU8_9LACO|nr:phosphoribosylamine--glycine ligase [Lacticaseibacillus pantheris]KRL86369.1 phosphoribosylamine-glycine ligase [Lacticaseibacillus pantheris DSM 15945 = JCM 12539 = NBRC 106106]
MVQHNVLIVGGGARESALGLAFRRAPSVDRVYVAPGNQAMKLLGLDPVPIAVDDFDRLLDFARGHVDLTFVGPEVPLVGGIVDAFMAAGQQIFGPHQRLAQLEGSKGFAKAFMQRHGIPTARSVVTHTLTEAQAAMREFGAPVVVKADGLAAGKGVRVAATIAEAEAALDGLYRQGADATVVVEEYLTGQEASVMTLFAGTHFVTLPLSQDHKRRFNGDAGPNTGGMGAISPAPQFGATAAAEAQAIVQRTITGIHADGLDGCGVLYTGLMFTADGPRVLEYNVRLGDPETQVLLPQIKDDLYVTITNLMAGQQPQLHLNGQTYSAVVLAHPGYPATSRPPLAFKVPATPELGQWLPAAVEYGDNGWQSSGGRVATVVGAGDNIQTATKLVYQLVDQLAGELAFREDIGYHALMEPVR